MNLTQPQIQKLHAELSAAVKAIGDKYQVKMVKSRAVYDSSIVDFRFSLQTEGGKSREEKNYERYAFMFGLPSLGTAISHSGFLNGAILRPVGMRVGGPYKSVILKRESDGKLFRISASDAQKLV